MCACMLTCTHTLHQIIQDSHCPRRLLTPYLNVESMLPYEGALMNGFGLRYS